MQLMKSVVLISLFVFIFNSSAAFAAQDGNYTYTESGGNATITAYTGTDTVIVIPPTLGGFPTVAIGTQAFFNLTSLTSITIPTSVTSIGFAAFNGCTGLTSITIPGSVTTIGAYAFEGCTGLTSATITDGVTSIGDGAFQNCTGLTSVTIPGTVASIGSAAFNGCTGLTSMTIPSSVTSLGNSAFYNCSGLATVSIPVSLSSIPDYAFHGCTSLISVTIPGSITSIGDYAFYLCTALTGAYFSGNAPTMGAGVFDNCAIGFTVYSTAGGTGFTNPWYGYPAIFCTDADHDGYSIEGGGCGAIDCNDNNSLVNPDASDATCNGIDDDCDGSADEGYVANSGCFLPGVCAAGNAASTCIAGSETACQTGTPSGIAESVCNGADDDCDSSTDEDYAADSSCFLPGVCAAGNAASTCVAGVETACAPGTPTGIAESVCNGVDDDCDGTDDEDYVSQVTNCGVGACATTGSTSCVSGGVVDSCTPGTSTAEVCNGIDDDCDGDIDNGLIFKTYYMDADYDSYGNADNATVDCEAPEGYVDNSTGFDCNDNDSAVNPEAEEVCGDGIDNNCDNLTDENCTIDNCTDADGDGYFVGEGCTPADCDDTDWKNFEGCEASPCSLQIIPKQIFKVARFFEPVVPYIIIADTESGIEFGTFTVRFASDAIRGLSRVRIGQRIIVGAYLVNPFKLEKGDTTAEVEMYGVSPDFRCATFTVR